MAQNAEGQSEGDETGESDGADGLVVKLHPFAIKEATKKLKNRGKRKHLLDLVDRLKHFGDQRELHDLRIQKVGSFYALKLKGGLLGKINLRIYFAHLLDRNEIVVLKVYKKEEENQIPRHIVLTVENRLEEYLEESALEQLIFDNEKEKGI
ncbi:hypothetical protein [Gimesia sp.]|uniref:hypothetical protein n=1 Tax=Gimesia sp. TaxID=2024833 RepID=UPI000C507199|nr:hypothetical protein [Gimesia sp.]MAX40050.1 hypothetical protein [Gimesia sp.]HAH47940.1 hypothetical protein [Planctomycetaceae bacterium]HBL42709.1 hypothetical protein [Planctomycetaceae bacterium]|tara:strand:+ start:627 stop:1082 length:456 start_codon:yes stop_codon:yes gene_type:complete